jgi:hypothetical protein
MAFEKKPSRYAFARIVITDKGRAMVRYKQGDLGVEEAAALAQMTVQAFLTEYAAVGWGPPKVTS